MKSQTTDKPESVSYLEERYEAGRSCYNEKKFLTPDERSLVAAHFIEEGDKEEASEVMTECNDTDSLGVLFGRWMKTESKDALEAYANALKADITKRYEKRIDKEFERVCEYMRANELAEIREARRASILTDYRLAA